MSQLLESAQTFILSNARLLERHLFAFLFHQGNPDRVRTALLAYQNADGGFGNALEPDKRTASSQPIDQEIALRVLDDIGLDTHIALQICEFLETVTTAEGGVPFVLPTVRDAPRAEWWNTDLDEPPASINPTASIAGLLHKYEIRHPWLDRATAYCWQYVEHLQISGAHDFLCLQLFLEHVADRERAERAFERISAQLLAGGYITYDPSTSGYVFMPLTYAPSPQKMSRRLFDTTTIEKHLSALANKQQMDGGWPISWPAVSPACELEYRGIVTLNALKTLKAYDYLK
ncbi:MAG: hypothetical protein HZB50_10280 [Chloroflexi bacterium]|nr:hypothetical protein [Chloroflexota bacterium]